MKTTKFEDDLPTAVKELAERILLYRAHGYGLDQIQPLWGYDGRKKAGLMRLMVERGYLAMNLDKPEATTKAVDEQTPRKPDLVARVLERTGMTRLEDLRRLIGQRWTDLDLDEKAWVAAHQADYTFFTFHEHRAPRRRPVECGTTPTKETWRDVFMVDAEFSAERDRRIFESRVSAAKLRSFAWSLQKLGLLDEADVDIVKTIFMSDRGFTLGIDETAPPEQWPERFDKAIEKAQEDVAEAQKRVEVYTALRARIQGGSTYAEDGGGWDGFLKANDRLVRKYLEEKPYDDD